MLCNTIAYLAAVLVASSSISSSNGVQAYVYPRITPSQGPNGTHVNGTIQNHNSTLPKTFPQWDGARCANSSTHTVVVEQPWVRAEDYQITPDCFAYGISTYKALKACAVRNVCFGNCTRTYKDCVMEWMHDPETRAAHASSSDDEHRWEMLPLEQYFKFNELSCKCREIVPCRHVNC